MATRPKGAQFVACCDVGRGRTGYNQASPTFFLLQLQDWLQIYVVHLTSWVEPMLEVAAIPMLEVAAMFDESWLGRASMNHLGKGFLHA